MNILPHFLRERIAHRPNLLKIADNISWLFFDKAMRMGVSLLVAVWVARYLGPAQYGIVSLGLALIVFFGAIAGLGLRGVVVRDIARDPACAEETLGSAAALQLVAGIAAYLLFLITIFYIRPEDPVARGAVALYGSLLLLECSKIAAFWFESQVESKFIVWVENGALLAFSAVKVVMILMQAPLIAFIWAMVGEATTVAVIGLLVLNKKGPSVASLHICAKRAKALLGDSWPLFVSGVLGVICLRADVVMLGQLADDATVGIYAAAVRISEVWYVIIPVAVNSIFPALTKLKIEHSPKASLVWIRMYSLMGWLSVIMALAITLFAEQVVGLLYGDSYMSAVLVLPLHVWCGVNIALGSVWAKYILLENKQKTVLWGMSFGAGINIGLNIYLIPEYGAIGAAIATLVSGTLSSIINFSMYKPRETFGYLWQAVSLKNVVKK